MLTFRTSLAVWILLTGFLFAQTKPRARDLGVPFDGTPGPLNAITDVKGVEVGHTTLISGEGPLKVGVGPVRTGVTAVLPRGKDSNDAVFAAWFTLNGNGEMTGTTWVEDSGFLNGPIMITNTHSVGVVRDAVIGWRVKRGQPGRRRLLVVAPSGGGNMGWLLERHQRLSCEARSTCSMPSNRSWRNCGGGKRRRRHGHDLQRIQRRDRNRLARARRRKLAATPSACWCSATTVTAINCVLLACR